MIVGYDFMTYETCPYRANTKDTSTAAAKSEQILGKSKCWINKSKLICRFELFFTSIKIFKIDEKNNLEFEKPINTAFSDYLRFEIE